MWHFRNKLILLFSLLMILALAGNANAYPDAEIVWAAGGGPPFSYSVSSTPSGFFLLSDTEMALSFGKIIKLIDAGSYAEEASQPPDITTDEDTNSIITAIAYVESSKEILASQENGNLLVFAMSDITAEPEIVIVAEDHTMGPIAVDSTRRVAYVADNSSRTIHVVDLLSLSVTSSITLTITGVTTFQITDALFLETKDEIYFTTDSGAIFYLAVDGTSATMININITDRDTLPVLAALPDESILYVINSTETEAIKIDTSTHAVTGDAIDLTPNSTLSDIVITEVTNPVATYAYVAGAEGVSVINTATDEVLDFGTNPDVDREPMPTSSEPLLLIPSSKDDGFVYMFFSTGGLGVISENPFVAITGLTYSSGGSTLGTGESITLTFMSDMDGTYEIRAGGGIDAAGALLTDSAGATSGSCTVDTAVPVTINYDDNSAAFTEGANDVWVFATTPDSIRGRRSTSVTVDTPPPDVTIRSTGFGNQKVYINFDRIDVEDMSTYNIYADTDPAAVLTKSDATATVSQPSSGTTVTGEVGSLTNGTLYYFAMEAVDASGNRSPNRTSTFADGSRVTGMPEQTEGPAGLSGEKGCSVLPSNTSFGMGALLLMPIILIALRRSGRIFFLCMLIATASCMFSSTAWAEEGTIQETEVSAGLSALEKKPPMWSFEAKTGFWMPTSDALGQFFGKCCNMWTRLEGSILFQQRYGIELGVGFLYNSGHAIGQISGQTSQDKYSFLLIPLELSFVWRADYFTWRYLIPYIKAGFDGVIFRESTAGDTVKGMKFGTHGAGGLQIDLGVIGDVGESMETIGIDDFFLTLDAQYQWINNFGASGLNLSGPVYSIGFLFEF
ncbi:MAG: hypothetical protein ABH871_09345 [Pseudomonadota bacterium]